MVKIGLTGGIATGKSTVLERFRRLGVPVVDADELAHGVMAAGTESSQAIAARFGDAVLAADGAVDRRRLAPIVFNDAVARRDLEAIVHPAVYRAIQVAIRAFERLGYSMVVVDIPLLFETGHAEDFDHIVVTACTEAAQVTRLMTRGGLTEPEARQRLAAQMPTADKVARADSVVRTDGAVEDTLRQVDAIYRRLRG